MKEVTDPNLIESLNKEVTDPAVLQQLEGNDQPNAVVQTVENIPGSAANFFGGIANAVLHPVNTVGGVLDAAAGGVQNAFYAAAPGLKPAQENFFYSPRAETTANAVGQFYKNRYGGIGNLRNTVITDPVGFAADVSAVTGLTGMGLRAAGMNNAAKVAETVSKATNPIYLATKTVGAVAKPVYKSVVGMTSGAGSPPIEEALKGSPEFIDAMRGKTTGEQIVQSAKDSLDDIKTARGDAYRAQLQNLKGVSTEIPIDDIKNLSDSWLSRYNIKKAPNGSLDFSRATVRGPAADEVSKVYEIVQDWGSQTGDKTPAMLDVLKRTLDDFYSSSRNSRAMVQGLKKAVQNKIVAEVPEYAQMTKDYAKTTELINEMEKALSIGTKSSADTALRKLTMAVREDSTFRRDLLSSLDKSGDITAKASGFALNPLWSRRLGPLATTLTAGGLGFIAASPKLLALTALASPRVVGEMSLAIGRASRAATSPVGRGTGILAYQASRIPQETQ